MLFCEPPASTIENRTKMVGFVFVSQLSRIPGNGPFRHWLCSLPTPLRSQLAVTSAFCQVQHERTVLMMYRDATVAGDVADDRIPLYRVAAFGDLDDLGGQLFLIAAAKLTGTFNFRTSRLFGRIRRVICANHPIGQNGCFFYSPVVVQFEISRMSKSFITVLCTFICILLTYLIVNSNMTDQWLATAWRQQ